MSGERDMALAVLRTALSDALGILATVCTAHARREARAEGLAFWTSDAPEWVEARTLWCEAAGICPRMATIHARRVIEMTDAMGGARGRPLTIHMERLTEACVR